MSTIEISLLIVVIVVSISMSVVSYLLYLSQKQADELNRFIIDTLSRGYHKAIDMAKHYVEQDTTKMDSQAVRNNNDKC